MKLTVYTIGCPKCNILETKLKKCGFSYDTVTDRDEMIAMGFMTAPMMVVENEEVINDNGEKIILDKQVLDFGKANAWINKHREGVRK